MFLVQQLHHALAERVQERNVELTWWSSGSSGRCAGGLSFYQDDGQVFAVDMRIESRAVVNLRHSPHNADNQVLHEEVAVLLLLHAMLDPFYALADPVLVKAEHVYLPFDDTAQQSSSKEFGLYKDRRRTAIDEAIRSCMEDGLSVLRQSPEPS